MMKTKSILLLLVIVLLQFSCTPEKVPSQDNSEQLIFADTGDDQSIRPDNERD